MCGHSWNCPWFLHLLTLFLVTLDQIMKVINDIGLLTRLVSNIFSLHELLISLISILALMRKLIVAYLSLGSKGVATEIILIFVVITLVIIIISIIFVLFDISKLICLLYVRGICRS